MSVVQTTVGQLGGGKEITENNVLSRHGHPERSLYETRSVGGKNNAPSRHGHPEIFLYETRPVSCCGENDPVVLVSTRIQYTLTTAVHTHVHVHVRRLDADTCDSEWRPAPKGKQTPLRVVFFPELGKVCSTEVIEMCVCV